MSNLEKSFNKIKFLSGSSLKVIAVVTMLIDHVAVAFHDVRFIGAPFFSLGSNQISIYFIMRSIGRLAFPLFCFLIAEGYCHSKDRLKYGRNLLIFAVISEIPFDLFLTGQVVSLERQNVYFVLALGLLSLLVIESEWRNIYKALFFAATFAATILLHIDYGINGVLLIVLFYMLRDNALLKTILSFPFLSGGFAAFCALVPINMYNGERGFIKGKAAKYFFYAFYPAHLLLLFIIGRYL